MVATPKAIASGSDEDEMNDWSLSLPALILGSGFITAFYLGFWLLGWWIPAVANSFDGIDQKSSLFWPALWFCSFFTWSFMSIRPWIKKSVLSVFISVGLAVGFSFLLDVLIAAAHLQTAPFFDRMF
jgi:hypothetical protein